MLAPAYTGGRSYALTDDVCRKSYQQAALALLLPTPTTKSKDWASLQTLVEEQDKNVQGQ